MTTGPQAQTEGPAERTAAMWLELLASAVTPPSLREEAVRRLATALMEKDIEIAALVKDLEELRAVRPIRLTPHVALRLVPREG